MNARTVVKQRLEAIRRCEHRTEKIVLALLGAIFSSVAIRVLSTAIAGAAPFPAWAQGLQLFPQKIAALDPQDFLVCVVLASWGGAASMFHELRSDMMTFSVLNAVGHMVAAQTAGIGAYLLALQASLDWPAGMLGCLLMGWLGNKGLVWLSRAWRTRVMGLPPEPDDAESKP